MRLTVIITLFSLLLFNTQAQCSEGMPEDVYTITDEQPQYPGGHEALMEYLGKVSVSKDGPKGTFRVFVKFVVDKSGEVRDAAVAKSSGEEKLDELAVQHVLAMQDWTPGTQEGKPVNVEMVIPFVFKMD